MPDQQVLLETAQAKVPLQSLFLTRILLQYLMTFDVLCLAYASRFSYKSGNIDEYRDSILK